MSEGWVAMHALDAPRIAWVRVEAVQGVTARPRRPLIAAGLAVVEVAAARALHHVSSRRRHIANLGGCTHQDCLSQDGIPLADEPIGGEMTVAHEGANAHAPVG
jgi:hypothetical protein